MSDEKTQGVTDSAAPDRETADVTQTESSTVETPVIADPGSAPDRTPNQMFRELQRKQAEQGKQLEQVLGYIIAQAAPKPVADAVSPTSLSDEELWQRAQAGDQAAFILHQQRISQKVYQEQATKDRRTQLVEGQMAALINRYPVLRDGSHPLTQKVNQAYGLYVQNGYTQGKETMLEAAKTAIADSPEIVSELHGSVRPSEVSRQTATARGQSGVTGVTHQQRPGTPGKKMTLSQAEIDLAKRMGVKDPLKAKENFLKRQEDGRSSLGSVAAFVNAEDL